MSKRQQSIMSFFGAKPAGTEDSPKPSTSVKSPKKATEAKSPAPKSPASKKTMSESKSPVAMKNKEDEPVASRKKKAATPTTAPGRKRLKRNVVDDDEDDDDDDPFTTKVSSTQKPAAKQAVESEEDDKEDEDMGDAADDEDMGGTAEEDDDVVANVEKTPKPKAEASKLKQTPATEEPKTEKPEAKKTSEAKKVAMEPFFAKKAETPKKDAGKATPKAATPAAVGDVTGYNEKEKDPKKRGGWKAGDAVPYAALARVFAIIEETSGRLLIQDALADFFRSVIELTPTELVPCIYLCVCTELAPAYENVQIGIGDAILIKSIGEATGTNAKFVKELYQKEGDLGKVALNARSKQSTLFTFQKPKLLSVQNVYSDMVKIARMTGNNSQASKCSIIKSLLVRCDKTSEEAKYVIRGLQGKLRIGLAGQSILMALTQAFLHVKESSDKAKQAEALMCVKRAFSEYPNYETLAQALLTIFERENGGKGLHASQFEELAEMCHLTPGVPVSPMLARPTKSYAMVLDRFQDQPFTCEYKYDGERAQIHILDSGDISIFSRNFENSTERFPDVKLSILKAAKKNNVTSCIVDAEVVAVDKSTNQRLPFQVLSTRSRKNVVLSEIKVQVCIYAFDVIYLNGQSLLREPLQKRREILKTMFEVEDGSFELATSLDVPNTKEDDMEATVEIVRTFLEEAVKGNCEGLMVKTLEKDATYEPANRSHKWLKLKKDYLDGIGDSTDLVPVGAFYGKGKRTGVYGAYLLACYDPETEMYQCITKLGTGLSDEVLQTFTNQFKDKTIDRPRNDYEINDLIKPDVWFEPSTVWEILGADLSISPKYTAAIGHVAKDKGISLRFPRFIRIRDDKTTTQATTAAQIADLYRAQGLNTTNDGGDDEDDLL
ncbi:DNA ligase [Achlya hypogyna]|uniref:DNA ligase n=1 Tax=Achlya hypogyna TaxID=1202772 RepID=A0A1V9YMZ8_ACHHY|nr:DNA ligase [Achlya hypogyna]